jgi:outer membrane protein assembly factor BamA
MILVSAAFGQTLQDTLSQESRLIALPLVFRTPETSWGFGAGAAYNFFMKSDTLGVRPSQVQAGAVYTLEEQVLLYFPFQLFFNQNQYLLSGELGYYYYFFRFYGTGNQTSVEKEEFYLASFPRLKLALAWALQPNFFVGLTYDYDRFEIQETAAGGLFDQRAFIGEAGAVISEPGFQAIYDSRDAIFYPSQGFFIQNDFYFSLSGNELTFPYGGFRIDARWFHEIFHHHIIAFQVVHEQQFGSVPFFRLAGLGGPKISRGYIEGRFRDQSLYQMQGAYRFPIIWRFYGEVFASLGEVAPSFKGLFRNAHWSAGVGVRFRVDTSNKLHLRADFAFGEDQSGFYLTVGEAF